MGIYESMFSNVRPDNRTILGRDDYIILSRDDYEQRYSDRNILEDTIYEINNSAQDHPFERTVDKMGVSKDFLKDIIERHNDQNDATRIHNLNITNSVIIPLSRAYNPEGLKYPPIDFDKVTLDIIFKEEFTPFTGSDKEIMTTVIGWDVVDMVRYFEPGDEIDAKTGKRVVVSEDPVEEEVEPEPDTEEPPVEEPEV